MLIPILAWDLGSTTATTLHPGRVIKGKYPYWQRRRKPYWESDDDPEEEEMMAMISMDD